MEILVDDPIIAFYSKYKVFFFNIKFILLCLKSCVYRLTNYIYIY